jgi:hypothetical protein
MTGEVIGTPEFMSPEQAAGQLADAPSDIYALGVVAFYAMTGHVPFDGATAAQVLAKHMTQPAPLLLEHAPAVPRRIARIVDACLAKDPAERHASAAALAEQLALTLERRKDLPVALRAFVKHDSRLDGPGVLLVPPMLVVAGTLVARYVGAAEPGFVTVVAGAALVPAGVLTDRARRLLKAGFEHSDLAVAFKTEAERGREERAFSVGPRASILERILGIVGVAGIGASIASMFLTPTLAALSRPALYALAALATVGWPCGIAYLALLQRRRDIDTEFWGKLWTGPIGRVLFRVARWVLPKGAVTQAMTHRPTELAIAMAAEQLFGALPKTTRRELGDLPAVVHRLEADAQRMRERMDELQDAVASGPQPLGADPSAGIARALREEYHSTQQQLADTVAALENIRLGLLRLSSGSGSVQSLTTDLAAARAVGQAVDLLLEGRREVDAALQPQPTSPPQP